MSNCKINWNEYECYQNMTDSFKEVYKIQIAIFDITAAQESVKKLLERGCNSAKKINDHYCYALLLSAVVSYARPFSGNRPQGNLDDKYLKGISEKKKKLHEKIVDCRNKVFAHTDGELFEVKYIKQPQVNGLEDSGEITVIINPFYEKLSNENIKSMPDLCCEIIKKLNEEKSKLMKIFETLPDKDQFKIEPNGKLFFNDG